MADLVSRRSFLLAAAGVAAGAAGCRDSESSRPVDGEPSAPSGVSLVVASYLHVAGIDERLTVAFVKEDGPHSPTGAVELTINGGAVAAERHDQGISLPYYLVRHRFPSPGIYDIEARAGGRRYSAPVQVVDPSATKVPVPGRPMARTPSPTVADPRGVNPVCTRRPACPLHDVSLDAALDERRPLAVLFATPALCQSQLCGPVLDHLLAQRDAFAGRVRFLHVEIFTDTSGKTLAPAVQAYGLQQEPVLFLAGADGTVRERLDNAYDGAEVRAALGRLVG